MKLKSFEHFNQTTKDPCPICKTKNDERTVLIGVDGTEDEGIMEAIQVHLNCIDLRFSKENGVLYQVVKP